MVPPLDPDKWEPIEPPEPAAAQQAPAPTPQTISPFLRATVPSTLQLQPDLVAQQYTGAVPQIRLTPFAASASPSNNSAAQTQSISVNETVVEGATGSLQMPSQFLVTGALPLTNTGLPVSVQWASGHPAFSDLIGIAAIDQGGTGTASPGLVEGTNVTISGTWPNQTIAASGGGGSFGGTNKQTGDYTALVGDAGALISFNISGAATLTLPASPPGASWAIGVENIGAGTLTVDPNGLDIDGGASPLTLTQNQGFQVFTDGTNYFTQRGVGGSGSGTVTTTGSPSSGELVKFSGSTSITNTNLTGDVTTSGGVATTLATVNTDVGSYTNANITVNAKGLVTAAANGTAGFTDPMTTEGDIIFENATPAPDRLGIGSTGQVLTVSGGVPAWADAAAGGGTSITSMYEPTLQYSSSSFATKGNVVTALQAVTIPQMLCNINGVNGDVYQAAILTMSSSTAISGILATSDRYTFTATQGGFIIFTFASPPTLTAGDIYFFCLQIITSAGSPASGTSICALDGGNSQTNWSVPGCVPGTQHSTIASVAPSSGTVTSGSDPYQLFVVATF